MSAGAGIEWTRRRVLARFGTGVLAASAAPDLFSRSLASTEKQGRRSRRPAPGRLGELAEQLRAASEEEVFAVAARRIADGATVKEMLAAIALAGVLDVSPRPAGTKFHVVLAVPAALALSEATSGQARWLPVFFNLNVLKWSQQRDIAEGDWYLPEAPAPATDDPVRARRLLGDAMRAWDDAAADRAVVAAARLLELDELFEVLWPMGIRDFHNIGHKIIHTSQLYRALQLMPRDQREPVLRSLVWGLLGAGPGPATAPYDANVGRAGTVLREAGVRRDPQAALELSRRLHTADSAAAAALVLEMLGRGIAPDSIWDGLRLVASEILFRIRVSSVHNAQLLAVHPLTIVNAARFAWERTASDETRGLLLLQTAAWMPMARDLLQQVKELSMQGPGIDELAVPDGSVAVDDAMRAADVDAVRSASLVLGATREQRSAKRFIAETTSLVIEKAPEHHHYKYSVAAFEEFLRTDPSLAPRVLAPCPSYLPTRGDPVSEAVRRARTALRGA